jgi:ATPase complex subunit ATP10
MDKSTQTLQERVYANKATLVCFIFNQFGEKHVKSFIDPFLSEFKDNKDIKVIEININEQLVKAPVMKLVTPYIRWKQSKEQQVYLD